MAEQREIVIVGSGLAGSILARILALQGRDVVLVEKGSHPRFALGESATPLAGYCLERLAALPGIGKDLQDLHALAAHGRWRRHLPHLGVGLKRGFTFFHHDAGRAFRTGPRNEHRLLVAASPHAGVADCHWLRQDVDHHLVRKAVEAGVDLREQTTLTEMERPPRGALQRQGLQRGVLLRGVGPAGTFELEASLLVDASGGGTFVARQGQAALVPPSTDRPASLLFAHGEGMRPFEEVARDAAGPWDEGPYPDDRAAVHHLLDQGWMYQLPFDHGVTSIGLVGTEDDRLQALPPHAAWEEILSRYPSLQKQLRGTRYIVGAPGAQQLRGTRYLVGEDGGPEKRGGKRGTRYLEEGLDGVRRVEDIRHRMDRCTGPGWVALPQTYAFSDPMFSTGMAWSLVAVERLARLIGSGPGDLPDDEALKGYGELLRREADQIDDLVEGAYAALPDFRLFTAFSFLYFAAASFQELRQRLVLPSEECAREGFLGATDAVSRGFVEDGRHRLEELRRHHGRGIPEEEVAAFEGWVRQSIAPRNVAGLAEPERHNLYPVDLDLLLERSELLGLDRQAIEAALPFLRGAVFREANEGPW